MNSICAVVVTYNRKDLLKENIEALKGQTYNLLDILVIDNNSTDGTQEALKVYIDNGDIIYKNTGENLGGAGGFAVGIEEAVKLKYQYIWLMDDDTIPCENALESLISKKDILDNKFSFLCSLAKFNETEVCKMNIPLIDSKWLEDYKNIEKGIVKVKVCSFVSCFINAECIEKVGLPIKEFFIYGDDIEYTERLSTINPGYIDINSVVKHKMKYNTNTNIIFIEKERIDRAFYTYRNRLYIAKKNGFKRVAKYLANWVYTIINVILKAPNAKLKRIKVMLKGLLSGIFFNPKIKEIGD